MSNSYKGRIRRQNRVRYKISKVSTLNRLSVFMSNCHVYAQLIDDAQGITLAQAGTVQKDFAKIKNKATIAAAREVGLAIGKLAIEKGVSKIVFDKGSYAYHGKVKALADAAREAGLQF
jgi:large subunit ribosomal protein L18